MSNVLQNSLKFKNNIIDAWKLSFAVMVIDLIILWKALICIKHCILKIFIEVKEINSLMYIIIFVQILSISFEVALVFSDLYWSTAAFYEKQISLLYRDK